MVPYKLAKEINLFIPAIESAHLYLGIDSPNVEESYSFGSPVPEALPIDALLGKTSVTLLLRAKDETFGLLYDAVNQSYMTIGQRVTFDKDSLIVGDEK